MSDLASGPSQELATKKKPFKARAFKEMKSWQLTIVGCLSVFESSLAAYLLGRVWPMYIEAINSSEVFSWLGLAVSLHLAILGVVTIIFAAVGKRCGELLYQRHLD